MAAPCLILKHLDRTTCCVAEYCESLWLAPGAASAGRLKNWESILQSKPQLLARLQICLRGKRDYKAVARM